MHDFNFLLENKFDIFGEYGNKNKMYTLAATLMQKLFGVAEPGAGEDSQFVSLAFTSVCKKSSRESLKEELDKAIVSASVPATCPSIAPNLNRRIVQKECEMFEALGDDLPISRLSTKLCLLFRPLLWKQKKHSVHVEYLLQNSGLVYMIEQSMHCVL